MKTDKDLIIETLGAADWEKTEKAKIVNGVNTEQLFSTIDLIKENPDIAKFKFRATNKWINGTHCRGTIKDFYGALQ